MSRFVVFREFVGIDIFYVEAESTGKAKARILPEQVPHGIMNVEWGEQYVPYLSAQVRDLALRALPIRRFPPGVWVAYGDVGEYRDIGPLGEPAMLHRSG